MSARLIAKRAHIIRVANTIMPQATLEDDITPEMIVDIQFNVGTTSAYLFTPSNIADLFSLYFLIQEIGIQATYDWLLNVVVPRKEELARLNIPEVDSIIEFESPLLADAKRREEVAISLQHNVGVLSDIASCDRCGSEKTYLSVKQTRSVDEGPTSIFRCPTCKAKWAEN